MKPTFRLIGLLAASAIGWAAAGPGQDPKKTPAMEAPADLDALIASMGLEEKVGQLFVTAGNANFLNEGSPEFQRLRHDVVDRHVGGIIWFRSKVYETAVLSARLQSFAKIPLLFTADLEAGMGMRFDDTPWAPWAMGVAATGDPALAEKLGFATAVEARALGVAQIYAPVADVNVNADNPVINTRSFGEDPKDVARFVTAFVKGCERGGVLATVKHFPGHGDTATDSHRSLPLITADRKRLDAVELLPFREAFRQGCRSVMIAHIAVPALDPTPAPARKERETKVYGGDEETQTQGTLPATVSPAIVHDLLRKSWDSTDWW